MTRRGDGKKGGGGEEGEINDHGVRVRRQKCQSVFTEAHYSCFETHKLSPGEQITGATQQQPTSSQSCMVAFILFLVRDLALIHSHSSDVLTPKGPCPAVTEQPPHCPTPQSLLSPCLLSKDADRGQLLSFYHTIVPPIQLRVKWY